MKKHPFIFLLIGLCMFSCHNKSFISLSGLNSENFDNVIEREKTKLVQITNASGAEVCITNYGARIVSIMMPDRNGKMEDMVCGFDNVADYYLYDQNFGSIVGRYIGRIDNAQLKIDGKTYRLKASSRDSFHGGVPGFADRVWQFKKIGENSTKLLYVSSDGENGFPGKLSLYVTYTLTDDNSLVITYEATTDKPTVLNPSNHSFFNISGNFSRSIVDQKLWIAADSLAEYNKHKCMTGQFIPVKDTPFDFTKSRLISSGINQVSNNQIKIGNGYDHTWKLNNYTGKLQHVASLWDDASGRIVKVSTTEPGLHIYTVNGLDVKKAGKHGVKYSNRTSICLETMHFHNSPNIPHFPSTLLRPGEKFYSQTVFQFGVFNH